VTANDTEADRRQNRRVEVVILREGELAEINRNGANIYMYMAVEPLAALVAGVLILAIPRLLNYVVAIYLIAIGVLGLLGR